jgi:hypothetical protein
VDLARDARTLTAGERVAVSASKDARLRTRHHLAAAVRLSPAAIRRDMAAVEGVNAKLAVLITSSVGTMACAWLFAALALAGLPAALKPGGEGIVAWVAQTFLQLVLLSIIMVGQRVQSAVSDARAVKQFADIEAILDALDEHTAGGIRTLLDRFDSLTNKEPPP